MVRQQQAVASYWIASKEFFSNSWHFHDIAAPIRAETSVFHIFRLFHNTLLLSINRCKARSPKVFVIIVLKELLIPLTEISLARQWSSIFLYSKSFFFLDFFVIIWNFCVLIIQNTFWKVMSCVLREAVHKIILF